MSPAIVVSLSLALLVFGSIATSLLGLNSPIFVLKDNQIFTLYSASEQVLAGIFGLTLTGFIFFRNELSREEFDDETLAPAVEELKDRYFKILVFITTLSVFTFFISNLVISFDSSKNRVISTILMNTGQVSFYVCMVVIAYFIFDVIAPKRIERASKALQQIVDPTPLDNEKGSLEIFLTNYNRLEYILEKYGQAYQFGIEGGRSKRKISNVRLAEFILRAEKIDQKLFIEIKDLITLRNSIIHGAEPVVSQRMIDLSENILQELAKALNIKF